VFSVSNNVVPENAVISLLPESIPAFRPLDAKTKAPENIPFHVYLGSQHEVDGVILKALYKLAAE